jgi:hypothetical protein
VLKRQDRERRIVCIGTATEVPEATTEFAVAGQFAPSRFVCTLPLHENAFAILDLRPSPGESFRPDAELATRVAVRVLQAWLVGAESTLDDISRDSGSPAVSEFMRRIEEELERAKRFDLRLSLVLIDIPAEGAGVQRVTSLLQDVVRQELRGSDVLGLMNGERVAALLTHTDGTGSNKVVVRLRHRLGETASRLNVAGVRVGHAAFSADCRTAQALVAQAANDAQLISH